MKLTKARQCVVCGKYVDAEKYHPGDVFLECVDSVGVAACTFDMTEEEAWHFWRKKYHELRDELRVDKT